LRRVIFAFATRTASDRVGFCFICGAFFDFSPGGLIGSTDVGTFEVLSTGCVVIGPVTGLLFGIVDNSIRPKSFQKPVTAA
jgi:hypothetical protein